MNAAVLSVMMTMTGDDIRVQNATTMTAAALRAAAMMMMTTVGRPAGVGTVIRKGIARRLARAVAMMMMTTTTAAGRAVATMTMAAHAAAAAAGRVTPRAMRKPHDADGKSADTRGLAVAPTMTTTTVADPGLETMKATAVGLAIPEDTRRLPVAAGTNGLRARGAARMMMTIVAGRGRVTTTRADGSAIRADMLKPRGAVGKIVAADR